MDTLAIAFKLITRREIDPVTGCWNWTGTKSRGYGIIPVGKTTFGAHRLSLHIFRGFDLASPLYVMHRCDNPSCFNPDHLQPGTPRENALDCIAKGRNNHRKGETHPGSTLTEEQVCEIRRLHRDEGLGSRRLAPRFGVSRGNVEAILTGRTWKHLIPVEEHSLRWEERNARKPSGSSVAS